MSNDCNPNMLNQLEIIDFIHQNLESSFNESTTKTLFDFYTSETKNATAFEITQLSLDILFATNVRPMIISDETLANVLREFCWKSCIGHECTISWKEFKSFFESQKQPLTKLLNIIKNSYNVDCVDIITGKYITFSLVKSNKNKIFDFDFDQDDRNQLKLAISKLAPTVSSDKIFTYIMNENKVSALILGAVDMNINSTQIQVNDIVYSIQVNDTFCCAFPQTDISEFYASEIITVYIDGINGTLTSVKCYSFMAINRFVHIVYDKLGIPKKTKLLFVHNHLIINDTVDKDKTLQYYNVKNNSCLLVYVADGKYSGHSHNFAQFGGVDPHTDPQLAYAMKLSLEEYETKKRMDAQKNIREKCCLLKLSDTFEFIEDLDILTYEMNTNCIKMSCGHGIIKDTLYEYTQIQLQNCETLIKCPHIVDEISNKLCNAVWYYPEVRNVLFSNLNDECKSMEFSLDDIIKLDRMCGMNTVRDDYKTKECIKCNSLLYKNKYSTAGWCTICNDRFCWKCDGKCDSKCSSNLENEVMDILKNCTFKTIGRVKNVPSIRCCPRCLQLITHTTACKHVKCASCKCSFCFVCMKAKKNGQWQCGSYSDICPIAVNEVIDPLMIGPPDVMQQNNMPPPNPMMGGLHIFGGMGGPPNPMRGGMPPPNPMMRGMPPPNPMMGGMGGMGGPPNLGPMGGMGGPPPNFGGIGWMGGMGGPPPDFGMGMPPNFNGGMGGMPPPDFGMPPPNFNGMGGMPPPNFNGMGMPPPDFGMGMPPPNFNGGMGMPPPNFGGMGGMGMMGPPPPNMMGIPPNFGGMPPPNNMGPVPSPPPPVIT